MPAEINLPSLASLLSLEDNRLEANAAAVDGVETYLAAYFNRLDLDRGNKIGGDRSHYWRQAADSLTTEVNEDGGAVIVNQIGARLHLEGGTILPVYTHLLAIPATAEAYGHSPTEFANLIPFFGRQKSGKIGVVGLKASDDDSDEDTGAHWQKHEFTESKGGLASRRRKRGGKFYAGEYEPTEPRGSKVKNSEGTVFYWLVESVTQQPDLTVLPPEDAMTQAAINSLKAYLNGLSLPEQTNSIYQDMDFIRATDKY